MAKKIEIGNVAHRFSAAVIVRVGLKRFRILLQQFYFNCKGSHSIDFQVEKIFNSFCFGSMLIRFWFVIFYVKIAATNLSSNFKLLDFDWWMRLRFHQHLLFIIARIICLFSFSFSFIKWIYQIQINKIETKYTRTRIHSDFETINKIQGKKHHKNWFDTRNGNINCNCSGSLWHDMQIMCS